ncbi:hypothetical protein CLV84_3441 [Neolewinella xylanilytica]|uniref:Uncharacterized protein n=1 Tax=Neolewinella xylanilytica TaxID=1514080 RepID=A0A2S6I5T1_9BACT|nr:hypothetical protein [Neolewinella xylanilytica]PPK86512.1 hypothetical protein CLV84_3441 [Neolewinella xylanilytica]
MVGKKLKAFGKAKGWHRGTDSVFGLEHGFQVNIFQGGILANPQFKLICVETTLLDQGTQSAIVEAINARKEEVGFASVETTDRSVAIRFLETLRSTKVAKLEQAIALLIATLETSGVRPHFSTFINEDARLAYVHNGKGTLLSKSEREELQRKIERESQLRKEEEQGYLFGAVGACAWGTLGVIVWVLVAYYFELITTFLAFLIAILSVHGYRKAGGTMGGGTKPVLIAVNLLLLVAATFFTFYIELHGYDMSILESWVYLTEDPLAQRGFYGNLAMSMLFGTVAVLYIVSDVNTKGDFLETASVL